jgi:hypothetical protein
METHGVLKINNKFHLNSLNVLNEFVLIIWWVYYSFWGHQFQKEIRWETCMLLYLVCCIHLSLRCDDYRTNIDYNCKFWCVLVICSCWFMSMPLKSIRLDVLCNVQFHQKKNCSCRFVIFVQCSTFATSIFVN